MHMYMYLYVYMYTYMYTYTYMHMYMYMNMYMYMRVYMYMGTNQGACGVNNSAGLLRSLGWRDGNRSHACSSDAILAQANLHQRAVAFFL